MANQNFTKTTGFRSAGHIKSDAESCCSDCSSVHSVGNFSLVSNAEDSEEDGEDSSETDFVIDMLEERK